MRFFCIIVLVRDASFGAVWEAPTCPKWIMYYNHPSLSAWFFLDLVESRTSTLAVEIDIFLFRKYMKNYAVLNPCRFPFV